MAQGAGGAPISWPVRAYFMARPRHFSYPRLAHAGESARATCQAPKPRRATRRNHLFLLHKESFRHEWYGDLNHFRAFLVMFLAKSLWISFFSFLGIQTSPFLAAQL